MIGNLRHAVPLLMCVLWAGSAPVEGRAQVPATLASGTSAPGVRVQPFDPAHSRFGFELRTRWGQKVAGDFPRYEGEVTTLPDGRHVVRIVLWTAAVQVADSPRYTELARGPRFFDSQRHPYIEFQSEPHAADLVRTGGKLRGRLTMHGVSRVESFDLVPPECERPAVDCDALAGGSVSRSDYNLDGWQFALVDRVRFTLRVRLLDPQP